MRRNRIDRPTVSHGLFKGAAVMGILAIVGIALAGPSGLLAWGDSQRLLEARRAQLARLEVERDELRNRVGLLDPRHADPDLAGELVRSRLNVAHPDEMVMVLR